MSYEPNPNVGAFAREISDVVRAWCAKPPEDGISAAEAVGVLTMQAIAIASIKGEKP